MIRNATNVSESPDSILTDGYGRGSHLRAGTIRGSPCARHQCAEGVGNQSLPLAWGELHHARRSFDSARYLVILHGRSIEKKYFYGL